MHIQKDPKLGISLIDTGGVIPTGNMGIFDRFRSKPVKKTSGLQEYLDSNIKKEARTPTYDAASAEYSNSPDKMLPPYDQYYLEYLAENYSHLRTVITKLASQTVAKGWVCEPIVDNPSDAQKILLEQILENPSAGDSDISGAELLKAIVRQLEIFDDAWISLVYDYVADETGQIIGKQLKQLWIEDTKRMRFMTDRFGRFQTDIKFNPITRQIVDAAEYDPNDGTELVPVAYVFDDEENEIPFARDEVIHFNKYSASARLYGQSPILGLARKIETGLAIEKYQNKIYRLERPPKGFLDIPGHDENGLTRLGEYIAEETKRNPNFIPIISSGEGKSGASFVPVMPNMSELEMLPYLDKINADINASYGVMPLAVGSLDGIGGLNSEGEQISMMDRTILETQMCIEEGFFRPLLNLLKITDYEIKFVELNEENEQIKLQNLSTKADIIAKFQQVGILIDMDEEGELILPEVIQSPDIAELPEARDPAEPADIFRT